MTAATIIQAAADHGVVLTVVDARLTFDAAPGALTDELRGLLRQHKQEIIDHLTGATTGMTATEETAFRRWCSFIGEHGAELIDDALERCRVDPVALAYFLNRSLEVTQADDDDRHPCNQCANLNGGGRCIAAQRGDIDAPTRYSPHPTIPRRCVGYAMKSSAGVNVLTIPAVVN